jgi:flagellar protein FlbD
MIELTRLNGSHLAINCDLIKYAEASPDTVLTLITGEKLVVLEPCSEVSQRTLNYRAAVTKGMARGSLSSLSAKCGYDADEPFLLSRAIRTLLPVAPTEVAIPTRSAGFGHRDRFGSTGKIKIVPSGEISSYRWQDNRASGMPPLAAFHCNRQPSPQISARKCPPCDRQ